MNGKSEWFTPQTILTVVAMLAAFGSFFLSFDRRVTSLEMSDSNFRQALAERDAASRDFRNENAASLRDINQKLDRLVERGK